MCKIAIRNTDMKQDDIFKDIKRVSECCKNIERVAVLEKKETVYIDS